MSFSRGLGLDEIMLKFLELYSDPKMLVLALNTRPPEEVRVLCNTNTVYGKNCEGENFHVFRGILANRESLSHESFAVYGT